MDIEKIKKGRHQLILTTRCFYEVGTKGARYLRRRIIGRIPNWDLALIRYTRKARKLIRANEIWR